MSVKSFLVNNAGDRIPVDTDGYFELFDGIEARLPKGARTGDRWRVSVKPFRTASKLGSAPIKDGVVLSNSNQLLAEAVGNCVFEHTDTWLTSDRPEQISRAVPDHRSPVLAVHYNHVCIAKGRTLWWTDLDQLWEWWPRTDNEADFREIEWESEDISALCVVNDMLFMHFPSTVYAVEYVGKPAIVRITQRNKGSGAVSAFAVATHKNSQFYVGRDNFYQWTPVDGVVPIGESIWDLFKNDKPNFCSLWAYVDQINKEVCFCFDSESGEKLCYAFNYVERSWMRYDMPVSGHVSAELRAVTVLSGQIGQLDTAIGAEEVCDVVNLWLGNDGFIEEHQRDRTAAHIVGVRNGYLETDDMTYGDVFATKSCDKIVLDAGYGSGVVGFKVEISARERVSQQPIFKFAGLDYEQGWSDQVDFQMSDNRVWRFRFSEYGGLQTWDGSITSVGGVYQFGERFLQHDGRVDYDGVIRQWPLFYYSDGHENFNQASNLVDFNFLSLYAWGERLGLPDSNVGADK